MNVLSHQSPVTSHPLHIAIIPDGNRRWAKERKLHPWDGHKEAIEHFRGLTEWCRNDPRVDTLTVWCFSTENWKRDEKEVKLLMKMLEDYLAKEREGFKDENTKFVHSGRRDRIPASLAKLIEEVEVETKDYDGFTLHLAVDYGGMDEVARAVNKLCHGEPGRTMTQGSVTPFDQAQGDTLSPELIRSNLDHPELSDIDLIIRTSGEKRTSNFFMWQSTYAEWDFLDKFFPDFTVEDLQDSVDRFSQRTRRFGS